VHDHLAEIDGMKAAVAEIFALFNARDLEGCLARHAEDVQFAIPMLGGQHDAGGEWGRGRAAFRDYLLMGFERHGTLTVMDAVPGGGLSVGVLVEDAKRERLEVCMDFSSDGLVTRVFAFPLPARAAAHAA
jgi:ketosteroid isomerase-like protein